MKIKSQIKLLFPLIFTIVNFSNVECENLAFLKRSQRVNGIEKSSRSRSILWDIHHGICPIFCHPDSNNTILQNLLEDMGHPIFVSDSGILNLNLNDFGVIISSVFTTWDSPYTNEEVSVFRDFVYEGGGLLIIGDEIGWNPENINPVAEEFGTTTGLDLIQPKFLLITDLEKHPIFSGVDTLYFVHAGRLGTAPPSIPVAREAAGRVVVTVVEYGEGRVVITGDANGFNELDSLFSIHGNELFTKNIIRWLFKIRCSSFNDLDETLAQADIDNRGIWQSLQSKASNARRMFERGSIRTAGNILCALLNEVKAQEGKHIEPLSASDIQDCVRAMAEVLDIPLGYLERKENALLHLEPFPNPFSISAGGGVTITSSGLANKNNITLKVYDISGRLIRTLVDLQESSVTSTFNWNGEDNSGRSVHSGVFFLKLTSGNSILTRKIIILK
jgi:hypothetical protein